MLTIPGILAAMNARQNQLARGYARPGSSAWLAIAEQINRLRAMAEHLGHRPEYRAGGMSISIYGWR